MDYNSGQPRAGHLKNRRLDHYRRQLFEKIVVGGGLRRCFHRNIEVLIAGIIITTVFFDFHSSDLDPARYTGLVRLFEAPRV